MALAKSDSLEKTLMLGGIGGIPLRDAVVNSGEPPTVRGDLESGLSGILMQLFQGPGSVGRRPSLGMWGPEVGANPEL